MRAPLLKSGIRSGKGAKSVASGFPPDRAGLLVPRHLNGPFNKRLSRRFPAPRFGRRNKICRPDICVPVGPRPECAVTHLLTFLVDRGTPGFTIRDGYKSVSHRGYKNMILEFDNCRLPHAQVLGEVDGGFAVMNEWLYATRITVATMSVGRARRCFDMALNYAAERKQFGQQIGKYQGISFQLADMITEIDAAEHLTLAAAWRLDQGLPANREIASAKLYASEMLARVTDATLQIFGGMGLMDDFPIERFWRDARVERIWDGTSEIQRHIISRDLLRPLGA